VARALNGTFSGSNRNTRVASADVRTFAENVVDALRKQNQRLTVRQVARTSTNSIMANARSWALITLCRMLSGPISNLGLALLCATASHHGIPRSPVKAAATEIGSHCSARK
jgi:hypothetical protein